MAEQMVEVLGGRLEGEGDAVFRHGLWCVASFLLLSYYEFMFPSGSGEATAVFKEWYIAGNRAHEALESEETKQETAERSIPIRRRTQLETPILDSRFPDPSIVAADPYTAAAFVERTGFPCSSLSFRDVSEGLVPDTTTRIFSTQPIAQAVPAPETATETEPEPEPETEVPDSSDGPKIEMVVCSFALHLVESPSELFSLLWELSTKARWLVVLAPHKKPEIKEGWGWLKWNVESWNKTSMSDHNGELLHERVHCRVYRSVNF
ncbi:hypothetical protein PM082_017654 [Marasmius tenuissimus]|nr:hypothetical protein PM082_017654 [Marasmius tenuissimus]